MGGETITSRASAPSYPKLAAGPVGKKIHRIYTDRLRMFLNDGQYYKESLLAYAISHLD